MPFPVLRRRRGDRRFAPPFPPAHEIPPGGAGLVRGARSPANDDAMAERGGKNGSSSPTSPIQLMWSVIWIRFLLAFSLWISLRLESCTGTMRSCGRA